MLLDSLSNPGPRWRNLAGPLQNNDEIDRLREICTGRVIGPSDAGYDDARRVWNGAVDHRPAMIVQPSDTADVTRALQFASERDLLISVRGGGYDWAGRAVKSGALVLDLALMASTRVDAAQKAAWAGGGASTRQVMSEAATHSLSAVGGAIGGVGIAGFTLGGGYGPLTPSVGLGVDNLFAAEVVLADGSVVIASSTSEPELYWALRGGGGNLGVVTQLHLALHQFTEVLTARALYPWSAAEDVVRGFDECLAQAPDELAATLALVMTPSGPAVGITACWNGVFAQGADAVDSLTRLAEPLMAGVQPMSLADRAPREQPASDSSLFSVFEPNAVPRRRYAQQTRWLRDLGGATAALLAAAEARTSPLSAIAIQSFHGFPTRVPADATAFGIRERHYLISIVAAWEHAPDEIHAQWAHDASAALAPFAFPGGYANLLGPDETTQLSAVYGGGLTRLRAAKRAYDPEARFTASGPISLSSAQ
jgi:FAD/FMN-containing dehydrogenase